MINAGLFKYIVEYTLLISLDLIVKNSSGKVLLGLGSNRPAKGCWFVPGGRVRKNEPVKSAFSRLAFVELGVDCCIEQASSIGHFEHFYEDNFAGSDCSTHYIALGYSLMLDINVANLPHDQHNKYRWFSKSELLNSPLVHQHTKNYFF